MKPTRALLLAMLLVPACGKPVPPPQPEPYNPVFELPEAYSEQGGLLDLTFNIAKFTDPQQYGGGATPMTLEARHGYTTMRFEIVVSKFAVSFFGSGTGDQFYQVLDELFKTNTKPLGMRALTKFSVETLKGNASDLSGGPVKLKLAHVNGAQFLLLIAWDAKKVTIRELDSRYRRQIIEAFKV